MGTSGIEISVTLVILTVALTETSEIIEMAKGLLRETFVTTGTLNGAMRGREISGGQEIDLKGMIETGTGDLIETVSSEVEEGMM